MTPNQETNLDFNRKERELNFRIRIDSGDPCALSEFVKDNMGLVYSIAKEFVFGRKHLSLNDLIQEGSIALFTVAAKFHPDKGNSFSSYAAPAIRRAVLRAILQQDSLIRLKFSKEAQVFFSLRKEMKQVLRRNPSDDELLSEWENLGKERAQGEIFLQTRRRNLTSLEKVSPEGDNFYLSDLYIDFDEHLEPEKELIEADFTLKSSEALHRAMSKLSERERRVVEGQFFDNKMADEIAAELSISRRSVYVIRNKAFNLLRDQLSISL